jgi:hypothetical protein
LALVDPLDFSRSFAGFNSRYVTETHLLPLASKERNISQLLWSLHGPWLKLHPNIHKAIAPLQLGGY